jgi:hypothetical protein
MLQSNVTLNVLSEREPARPGFPPEGETGKREIKKSSSLPQAFIPLMMTRQTIVANSFFFILFVQIHYNCSARKQPER